MRPPNGTMFSYLTAPYCAVFCETPQHLPRIFNITTCKTDAGVVQYSKTETKGRRK